MATGILEAPRQVPPHRQQTVEETCVAAESDWSRHLINTDSVGVKCQIVDLNTCHLQRFHPLPSQEGNNPPCAAPLLGGAGGGFRGPMRGILVRGILTPTLSPSDEERIPRTSHAPRAPTPKGMWAVASAFGLRRLVAAVARAYGQDTPALESAPSQSADKSLQTLRAYPPAWKASRFMGRESRPANRRFRMHTRHRCQICKRTRCAGRHASFHSFLDSQVRRVAVFAQVVNNQKRGRLRCRRGLRLLRQVR